MFGRLGVTADPLSCATGIRRLRLAFAAYEPVSGATQSNAMLVKKRSEPTVTRAVTEKEEIVFITGFRADAARPSDF